MSPALAAPVAPADWPAPPAEAVYYGLAGDIVRAIEPHTESDPFAVLSQLLVAFGNLIGRGPHRIVGATAHHVNEFLLLIGPSSKGRKGSSWDCIEEVVGRADPEWANTRIQSGMASGEGLIWHVRDAGAMPLRPAEVDPGVEDKRLLVMEPEFALVLRVLAREGNTLSAVVRNAWDGKPLQTMSKNSPVRASGSHISIVGHISADELLRYINATELANGFLNRFTLVAVRRAKLLPDGGDLRAVDWRRLRERLATAVEAARRTGELTFTPAAREHWTEVYPQLSVEVSGLYGAVIARAEAHVLRYSLIYALLDGAAEVDRSHLDAALAVWSYAARSARWVFGDTLGDPVADDIWQAMASCPHGLTREQIRDLFSRNKSAKVIAVALATLERAGRVCRDVQLSGKDGGRPAEVYRPIPISTPFA